MSNFIREEITTMDELESLIGIFGEEDLLDLKAEAEKPDGTWSLLIQVEIP